MNKWVHGDCNATAMTAMTAITIEMTTNGNENGLYHLPLRVLYASNGLVLPCQSYAHLGIIDATVEIIV
jgi:hypothetical protein